MQTNIKILNAYVELDNLVIFVDKDDVLDAIITLKNYSFDILSDMSAIHLSYDSFEMFYQLLSIDYSLRIRLKTHIIDSIQSISKIHRNAIWCEREVYDMFGIKFEHHPALRRILMSDDWSGHPLRKDYPLAGDMKVQWYEVDKIFGEEYRDIIGPENRNPSYIDPKDTFNFAHMGFEVPKGNKADDKIRDISYQESEGVFVVTKFDKSK